ncbi:MAG: HAMP domain-containing sensor histidine kinase [Balneolaceae bacterium]|nr:HAMP domain-containing sensor histidine kinase [Balneolaceae bacterium]
MDERNKNREERDTDQSNSRALYEEMTKLNNELAMAQRKLAKKTSQLERINEQKNMMLGMAAHDLRNPLSAILGFSSLLLEDHEESGCFTDQQLDFIREIHSSSKLMLHMVEDMLDISSIESGKVEINRQEVDLVDLMRHTASLYRGESDKKGIALCLQLTDEPRRIEADRHKLVQVLNNLLSNAIKYSESGTTVTLGMHEEKANDSVTFFVRDEGVGISEEDIDKLFQPFAKLKSRPTAGERSTGLGLAITRKIVQAHGGRIRVESEVGRGSTFYVSLPTGGARNDSRG